MRSTTRLITVAALGVTAAMLVGRAQGPGRTNANWPTVGADAQRTSWMRNEIKLSAASMATAGFQFLWKASVDNQPAQLNALTQPLLLQNIISHKGFKALAFVGGSADVVYAIDYDLNRVYWKQRLSTAVRPAHASITCPGGLTTITRATPIVPPGLPGARGGGAGRGGPPGPGGRGPAPTGPPPNPNRGGINVNNLPINSAVYAVSSGGMLHFLNPHTGEDIQPAVKFLAPNAKAAGLIQIDNVLYAATADNCGGVPNGVWALDLGNDARTVARWETGGASVVGNVGVAFDLNGRLYASTGPGPATPKLIASSTSGGGPATPKLAGNSPSEGGFSNAVVALEPKSLKLRDYVTAATPFVSAPVAFRINERDVVAAANSDGRLYLLDSASLGGADHTAPLARSAPHIGLSGGPSGALATWESEGTRWILVPAAAGIVAFKIVNQQGALSLEPAWTSPPIVSPLAPTILNDIVFAVASGLPSAAANATAADQVKRAGSAVLYALDGRTGKEIWNSGKRITSFAPGVAPSAGDSQVYVVTYDGSVYAFGLPLER